MLSVISYNLFFFSGFLGKGTSLIDLFFLKVSDTNTTCQIKNTFISLLFDRENSFFLASIFMQTFKFSFNEVALDFTVVVLQDLEADVCEVLTLDNYRGVNSCLGGKSVAQFSYFGKLIF